MQKKKIVNFRPIFFAFVVFCLALLISGRVFGGQLVFILLFLAAFLAVAAFCIRNKNLACFLIFIVFLGLGFSGYFITVNKWNNSTVYSEPQTVHGIVVKTREYANSQSLVVGNVKIKENKNFNISVYVVEGDFKVGEQISFTASLEKEKLFNLGRFSSHVYNNNILYTTQIRQTDVLSRTQTPISLRDKVKNKTLENFNKNMPEQVAQVAYGAMFGDSENIDQEIYQSFADSGIIHILSVSGMHMAFVVAILNFFLSKTKLNKKLRLALFGVGLFFYAYLCSFNTTVVRSALMSMILILGTNFGKRYDMLNAIGLSGVLLLLIRPLSVFEIGFQLSYLSVLMIALFSKQLTHFLTKLHLPESLALSISISLAVQVGLLPITLKHFGQFPLMGLIANLIAVPIFEVAFIAAFVLNIVLMLAPFLSFLLFVISFLFSAVIWVSSRLSSLGNSLIITSLNSSVFVMFFIILLFVLSGFVMLKPKVKLTVMCIIACLGLTLSSLEVMPRTYNNLTIFQMSYRGSNSTIFAANNNYLLVSDFKNLNNINLFLNQSKIKHFDIAVMAEGYNKQNAEEFKALFPNCLYYAHNQSFVHKGFEVSHVEVYNNKKIPVVSAYGYKSLVLTTSLADSQIEMLQYTLLTQPVNIFVDWQTTNAHTRSDFYVTPHSLSHLDKQINQLNNWYFELNHATINLIRSLD